ncbi:inositol phosphate phosphatase SopB [Spongorhabdus nitratireducens]
MYRIIISLVTLLLIWGPVYAGKRNQGDIEAQWLLAPEEPAVSPLVDEYYQANTRTTVLLERSPYEAAATGQNYNEQAEELRRHATRLNRFLTFGSYIRALSDLGNTEAAIRHQQARLHVAVTHLDMLHKGDFRNEDQWRRGHQVELEAVLLAIRREFQRLSNKSGGLSERKQVLVDNLLELQSEITLQLNELPMLEPNGDREHMQRELKNYQKSMAKELKTSGMSGRDAKRLMEEARKDVLVELPWEVVHKTVPTARGDKTILISMTQTPASKMRYDIGLPGHHTPFEAGYSRLPYAVGPDVGGISSMIRDEAYHAANLWSVDVRNEFNDPLFLGVRSGTLCAFGIKNDRDRLLANQRRAREVITAALLQQFAANPQLARDAEAGKTIRLRLMSNALLSTDFIRHFTGFHDDELSMFREQLQALHDVVAQGLPVILRDASGGIHPVQVDIQLAVFNVGVNGIALGLKGLAGRMDGTWWESNRYNNPALTTLIGNHIPGHNIGGWAGEWLLSNPGHPDVATVLELIAQIRDIWHCKAYQREGNNACKLAERLIYLAWKIGAIPHWSCKSGKDRTGEVAASVAWLAAETELSRRVPDWRSPLTRAQKTNAQGMLVEGGQMEITQDNIGRPLLKTGTGKKRFGTPVYRMIRK